MTKLNNKVETIETVAGDFCKDRFYPAEQNQKTEQKRLALLAGGSFRKKAILKRIWNSSYIATKCHDSELNGKRLIKLANIMAIINFVINKDNKGRMDDAYMKEVINALVKEKYLSFKKYEGGALQFYMKSENEELIKHFIF